MLPHVLFDRAESTRCNRRIDGTKWRDVTDLHVAYIIIIYFPIIPTSTINVSRGKNLLLLLKWLILPNLPWIIIVHF